MEAVMQHYYDIEGQASSCLVIDQFPCLTMVADRCGLVLDLNTMASDALGVCRSGAAGKSIMSIISAAAGADAEERLVNAWVAVMSGKTARVELTCSDRSPSRGRHFSYAFAPLKDMAGKPSAILVQGWDVTSYVEYAEKLQLYAFCDECTGLFNRRMMMDRLRHAISRSSRSKTKGAVMFIDLDGFKQVNDSLGHAEGDLLLQLVSYRLRDSIRSSDTLARYGGDEFVVILDSVESAEAAILTSERILESLKEPFPLKNGHICIAASAGLSVFPDDGDSAEIILQKADGSMYAAKRSGGRKVLSSAARNGV
jgi:diguanylate cyclase (GGDEF)-like protein